MKAEIQNDQLKQLNNENNDNVNIKPGDWLTELIENQKTSQSLRNRRYLEGFTQQITIANKFSMINYYENQLLCIKNIPKHIDATGGLVKVPVEHEKSKAKVGKQSKDKKKKEAIDDKRVLSLFLMLKDLKDKRYR